jgi:rod shape-determining protein MreC
MAILDIRQRTGYLFLAVTVGHIILISAQVNTARGVPMLEAVTFGVFAEVQRGAGSVIEGAKGGWEGYFALQQVRQDNERLRAELGQLQVRLQEERALAQQSRGLQNLLELRQRTELSTTGATVIAGAAAPDFRTVTVDKGTSDGLRPDQAVISPAGVVGRIIMPSARAAKVQLLIDRNASAGALVERSRAQGVVVGNGGDRLRMEYVSSTADVQVGDLVVTSGIEGIYPKGFVIGQIKSIEKGADTFSSIEIEPAVDYSSLEDVLVVLTPPVVDAVSAGEPGTGTGTGTSGTSNANANANPNAGTRNREPGT